MSAAADAIESLTESLTGFDEIAIAKHFGASVEALSEGDSSTMFLRSLVFVLKRREGRSDVDAFSDAMSLTIGQVHDNFLVGDDDSGKDETPSETPSDD